MDWRIDEPHPETLANFALMETRPGAMERYWQLAVETSRYQTRLKADGILNYPSWIGVDEATRSIHYLSSQIPPEHYDSALFSRWNEWVNEFDEIYQSSPKWRLKEMISQVSEAHACLSWPNRWEREIWNWAMSDDPDPVCPFVNRRGYFVDARGRVDPSFRHRLRGFAREAGGFLYRSEESSQIVFVPTEGLERIWRHQDHLADIDRNKLFGFFHDASRPNFIMRAPTEEEERLMALSNARSCEKGGWRAKLAHRMKDWFR